MYDQFVIDTTSLISTFDKVFEKPPRISGSSIALIRKTLLNYEDSPKMIIPSIVIIEIYDKWIRTEEFRVKFNSEVYFQLNNSLHTEIKPIESEIVEILLILRRKGCTFDIHDRMVLATAMLHNCPLITSDAKIISFVQATKVIPLIFS